MATTSRTGALLVAALLFATFLGSQGKKQTVVNEVRKGLFLLLARESESCTSACNKSGLKCSFHSLSAGSRFGVSSRIAASVSAIGGKCEVVIRERNGRPYPVVDARNRCYSSSVGRNNYDCDFIPTMSEPTRRICACFGEPGSPSLATPAPTTRAPTPVSTRAPTPVSTRAPTPVSTRAPTPLSTSAPTPTNVPASPAIPAGYTLSWRDDFDGPDLDTNNWSRGLVYDADPSQHIIWNPQEGGPHLLNSKYHGYILDADSFVRNGKLMLANREHNVRVQGTAPKGNFRYSSGWVNSLRKRFFNGSNKGAYLEVRAKFPEGPKVWPAIWMVAEEYIWPPEIDIWEYFGVFYNPDWGVDEMHLRNIWGDWRDKKSNNIELQFFHENYSGFKTLGWLWTSTEMTWYIEGVEVATKRRGRDIPSAGWPNQDLSLVLNNGLMSDVAATTRVNGKTTTFPNYLEIDYIALYEEADTSRVGVEQELVEAEYVVLLGDVGESCTRACSRNGLECTVESLLHGDSYMTSSKITETASSIGANCSGGVHTESRLKANPQVDSEGRCHPTPTGGQASQDCDAVSNLLNSNGKRNGYRFCTCEKYNEFWA